MIRALSPFYIDTPLVYGGVTCAKYTLNVWVWNGDKSTPDNTNSYQITYQNTTASTGSHSININAIIQDYIEFTEPSPTLSTGIQLIDGNNQQWVYTYVTYDAVATLYHETTQIMMLGYAYGNEGRNVTAVSNQTLLKPQEYKVNREKSINISIRDTTMVNMAGVWHTADPMSMLVVNWEVTAGCLAIPVQA